MPAILDHVVVEPPHERILMAVLAAFRDRKPLGLVLETWGVDQPWARRREIHTRVVQLTMSAGWLLVGGRPVAAELSDWFSIRLRIWNDDGPPRPWRSWEDDLRAPGETPTPEAAVLPMKATLLIT